MARTWSKKIKNLSLTHITANASGMEDCPRALVRLGKSLAKGNANYLPGKTCWTTRKLSLRRDCYYKYIPQIMVHVAAISLCLPACCSRSASMNLTLSTLSDCSGEFFEHPWCWPQSVTSCNILMAPTGTFPLITGSQPLECGTICSGSLSG